MRPGGAWSAGTSRLVRVRAAVAALVAMATVSAATVSAATSTGAARQELPDRLSIGTWRGHGSAVGVTSVSGGGAQIVITGSFGAELDFTVPAEGATTGRWDLNGQTSWRLLFGGAEGNAFMTHSAVGDMAGDRVRIGLGQSQIISTGSVQLPTGGIPVSSVDAIGPLDLEVTARFCDDVYGEWIVSWNTILAENSFTPTFRGNWQARRLAGEGPSVERSEELMPRLFELRERLIATWRDAEEVDGVPVLPIGEVATLLQEAIEVVNLLNNLTDCDVEYLGEDNVRQWIYSFTTAVTLLNEAYVAALERIQEQAEGVRAAPVPSAIATPDLVRWATVLAASGAIGPGALDPGAPTNLDRLVGDVERAVADAPSDADRVTAAALADQLGLGAG